MDPYDKIFGRPIHTHLVVRNLPWCTLIVIIICVASISIVRVWMIAFGQSFHPSCSGFDIYNTGNSCCSILTPTQPNISGS